MRGARRRLRDMVVSGGPGADLGTPNEVIDLLASHHPEVKKSTLKNYLDDAADGSLGDLGDLRLQYQHGRLIVKQIGGGGGADSEVVKGLLAKVSAFEERIAGLRPMIEIRVKDHEKLETRKVKGTLPKVFQKLVKLASIRANVLMVGPSGCGKTFLAEKVAEALKLSFGFLSCSAGMSEGNIAGRLLPIEVGGRFVYVPSSFVECFENGGVFLFDEIDASDANTLTFINAALANGVLSLPQRPEKPVAKRHKDFVCLAAANTFGHGANRIYAGRNQLDGATLDRFRAAIVLVDYSPEVEQDPAIVDPEVYAWGKRIRDAINSQSPPLRRIMSTRVMKDFTLQKKELGFGREEWEESYFADWSADERAKVR